MTFGCEYSASIIQVVFELPRKHSIRRAERGAQHRNGETMTNDFHDDMSSPYRGSAQNPQYPEGDVRAPYASPYADRAQRGASQQGRSAAPRRPRPSARSASGQTPRVARAQSAAYQQNVANERYRQAYQQRNAVNPHQASPYQDQDRYRRIAQKPKPSLKRRIGGIVISLGVVAAIAGGVAFYVQSLPVSITLNGNEFEVGGDKTIADVLRESGIKPQPGDLVAVDGSVLEAGQGEPFHATVNGEATTDTAVKLAAGDVVELGNGNPIEEPSDSVEAAIPYEVVEEGTGAIHLVEGEGTDGVKATKTGKISGLVAEQVTKEPSNIVCRKVEPEVGNDKVIALTFDDGPWQESTNAVLDVLKENGAKATFFTVGNRISGEGVDHVKRAAAEGHQICTHSFDHADGSGQGVNLGYMTPEEQVAEIQKGYEAIEAATGTKASRVIRTPGGNFGTEVIRNLKPLISSEIGWNIDTTDWKRPGADAIVNQIESAWPGAIILMHDGGGDRSQTVEALKQALPYLKQKGYTFVTIDELLEYPLS